MRESRYVRVARIAYGLAQVSLPRYSHAKSPHRYTLAQRVACVLLREYLRLSSRDMEEWLLASSEVRQVLELGEHIPDHSTLTRTQGKLTIAQLTAMQQVLLQQLEVEEVAVALDSTNFRLQHASAYYMTRTGRQYKDWVKGAYGVGIQSQLIIAWRSGRGLAGGVDIHFLTPLRRQAARWMYRRGWVVIADAGFDGRVTKAHDLIPVQRRHHDIKAPERKARADLVAQARLDGLYGQRWKVETVHSVIKRKFGDTIRSRRRLVQFREPLLKALVYNIHV
ncbi:MAG: transposase [Anaerolineae bacterium]|nr:transposase [Anaerolineae bacterium]